MSDRKIATSPLLFCSLRKLGYSVKVTFKNRTSNWFHHTDSFDMLVKSISNLFLLFSGKEDLHQSSNEKSDLSEVKMKLVKILYFVCMRFSKGKILS